MSLIIGIQKKHRHLEPPTESKYDTFAYFDEIDVLFVASGKFLQLISSCSSGKNDTINYDVL